MRRLQFGILWTLCLIFCVTSCQQSKTYVPHGLRKLEKAEILDRTRHWNMIEYDKAILRNERGIIVPHDSLSALWEKEPFALDPYVNDQGEVIEAMIRKRTPEDSIFQQRLQQAMNDGPDVKLLDVDCDNLKSILTDLGEKDQNLRQNGAPHPLEDFKNLEVAVSIIEKCGMPTYENVYYEHIQALWLVFQHAAHRYRKAYFPYFKEAVTRGELSASSLALMEDRILMMDGLPQKYGSQLRGDGNGSYLLHELDSPQYVDERRGKVGLGPLKDYLLKFGVEFDIPQRKKPVMKVELKFRLR